MAHTALGAAAEIHRTAQDLVGITGQDTGGVHLAQGIFADLDGDIVVIQHVIVASEVDGVQVVLALVVVLQRAGAADGDLAAQLDAHLLHPGTGGLPDGNSAPAAGVVAQQLHLYQFHVGTLGGVDAHERSGHPVLGIAAQHLHDGQAAALGGVDGQAAQRAGVGLVQLYLKDGGRLDGSALAHGEMLFHVGIGGQEGIGIPDSVKVSKISVSGPLVRMPAGTAAVAAAVPQPLAGTCGRAALSGAKFTPRWFQVGTGRRFMFIFMLYSSPLSQCCPSSQDG